MVSFSIPETVTAPFVVATSKPPSDPLTIASERVGAPLGQVVHDILGTSALGITTTTADGSDLGDLLGDAPWMRPTEQFRLGEMTHHIVIAGHSAPLSQPSHAQAARAVARAIAAACDGLIYDAGTHQVLPYVARRQYEHQAFFLGDDWMSVFVSDESRGTLDVSTLGLHRFGLPDFDVPRVPTESWFTAISLLRCVAARMLDDHWAWLRGESAPGPREIDDEVVLNAHLIWAYWGVDAEPSDEYVRVRVLADLPSGAQDLPVVVIGPPTAFHGSEELWWNEVVQPTIPFIPQRPVLLRAA